MRIFAIGAADARFHKMRAVYDACAALGCALPDVVEDYFRSVDPTAIAGEPIDITTSNAVRREDDGRYHINPEAFGGAVNGFAIDPLAEDP